MKHGSSKFKSVGMLGIAAASVAGLGIAPAANAATPATSARQWHVIKSVNEGSGQFTAVVATGPASGWAFESSPIGKPVAYERTGATTWKTASFPGLNGEEVVAAEADSKTDVWAFATIPGKKTVVLSLVKGKWLQREVLAGDVFQADVVDSRNVTFYVPKMAYHFNGAGWTKTSDSLSYGDALSASDGWTYNGATVTHIHGKSHPTWNLASLLPAKAKLNSPRVAAVYAVSDTNVYAIGTSDAQDAGGPTVVLHYNGNVWTKLATASVAGNPRSVSPDGSGGLWIPVSWGGGGTILHFSGGKLTVTPPPLEKGEPVYVDEVSQIPGTAEALAIASTSTDIGEILQYS